MCGATDAVMTSVKITREREREREDKGRNFVYLLINKGTWK